MTTALPQLRPVGLRGKAYDEAAKRKERVG